MDFEHEWHTLLFLSKPFLINGATWIQGCGKDQFLVRDAVLLQFGMTTSATGGGLKKEALLLFRDGGFREVGVTDNTAGLHTWAATVFCVSPAFSLKCG